VSLDIGDILRDWPYEPNKISARRIRGADGRQKIQLRLDLGVLQMETSGRPDGRRPHDCESLLDYHQRRLRRHRRKHGADTGFRLGHSACEQLRGEARMYYHRYLAAFVLEDFEAVVRDTRRNLQVMDLCRRYAESEGDRDVLEQYRPYVIMMYTRARALAAHRQDRPRAALAAVKQGLRRLERLGVGEEQEEARPEGEIAILRTMARELAARIPRDPVAGLREALSRAVSEERYEDAAILRDQLRGMTDRGGPATV
jgi:hypothetical protein